MKMAFLPDLLIFAVSIGVGMLVKENTGSDGGALLAGALLCGVLQFLKWVMRDFP